MKVTFLHAETEKLKFIESFWYLHFFNLCILYFYLIPAVSFLFYFKWKKQFIHEDFSMPAL